MRAPHAAGAAEHGDAATASGATPTPPTPRALEAPEAGDGRAAFVLDALVATRALTTTGVAELVAPNVGLVHPLGSPLDGELYASSTRLDWRTS